MAVQPRIMTVRRRERLFYISMAVAILITVFAGFSRSYFLKAHFGDRVQIFEELDSGAGRLDIYLVAFGGLSAVLELKILGRPYSTTYAFSGKEQIVHYMEQKKCHLGYLLIFDGRARDFGKGLNPVEIVRSSTVMVTFVDLRRSVKGDDEDEPIG